MELCKANQRTWKIMWKQFSVTGKNIPNKLKLKNKKKHLEYVGMKKQVKRKHIPCFNIFGNIYLCCDFFLFLNVCSHAMTKTSLFINNNRYSYLFSKRLCVYHRFYLVGLKVCKNYIEIHYTCTVLHNFWLIFNNLLNM
jgi:hypothetical protein